MANCLVIGGNGLIGSHIAEQLAARGDTVRVFDNFSGRDNLRGVAQKIEKVKADYLDREAVRNAMDGIEVVFHSLHTTVPRQSIEKPLLDAETNILPGISTLQAAAESGVKKFVYLSSIAVYGNPAKVPIKESDEPMPASPYGVSKLAIEEYVKYFSGTKGLDYVIVRPSATYGERQNLSRYTGVVVNFVHSAVTGKPVDIYGDGSALRDLTHAEDIAKGAIAAAFKETKSRVFNLGTGKGITLNELAGKVRKVTGRELKVNYVKTADRVLKHVYDVSRARKELGWKAEIGIEEGIRRCSERFRGEAGK